jgi:hypothetical protein
MQDRCLLYAAMEIKKKGSQRKQTNTKTSQAGTSLIDFNRTMGVAGRCSMFMFMLEDVRAVEQFRGNLGATLGQHGISERGAHMFRSRWNQTV